MIKPRVNYFRSTEPYKEADTYFNYHTVEAVSEESGIGTTPKDTYFKLSYDKDGKVVPTEDSTAGAMYIGNNVITSYYKATIVIVNDKNMKKGSTVTNKRFTVYTTPDEKGMEFAAKELENYFTSQPEGYRASTEEEKAAQRIEFLKALYYTWYGVDYAPVLSRAYNESFVENGKPIDLAPYFHTYVLGKEIEGASYHMTYYEDDKGAVGKKLKEAPAKAGVYHAKAELILDEGENSKEVVLDGQTYHLPLARGWTTYEIKAQGSDSQNPDEPKPDGQKPGNAGSTGNQGENKKPAGEKGAAKTGDESPIMWSVICMMAAMGLGIVVLRKRKER